METKYAPENVAHGEGKNPTKSRPKVHIIVFCVKTHRLKPFPILNIKTN